MSIRLATVEDAGKVQSLISQLGFSFPLHFFYTKLQKMIDSSNDLVFVYQHEGEVVGLITLHFFIQLGFQGDIMSIGYMVVDEKLRGLQIGKKLEEYATKIAEEKECAMIEVYSQAKRTDAHRFYERQGYTVVEKFFMKEIEAK